MGRLTFSGDAVRRFDDVVVTSIEKKDDELEDLRFTDYVINYTYRGDQRFVELRYDYVDEYKEGNLTFIHSSLPVEKDEDVLTVEKRVGNTFMTNLLNLLENAIISGKPVNFVIVGVRKGAIVEFLKKAEFA
jgi:hypothetical protein